MKIRNIVKGGVVLAGLAVYATVLPAAHAAPLQSPDSDALVAGYQVIQFNLKECLAITGQPGVSANGSGLIPADVRKIAGKMCDESREYKPKLEALAKAKDFTLPTVLPYTLTARYSALVRNQNGNMAQQYLDDQISSHEDALAIFQDEATNGTDPDIKAAANDIIPTVTANLATLKALSTKQ